MAKIPGSKREIKVKLDFGSLWGHYHLRTASKMKSDLSFEFSDPKYQHSHEFLASKEPFGL